MGFSQIKNATLFFNSGVKKIRWKNLNGVGGVGNLYSGKGNKISKKGKKFVHGSKRINSHLKVNVNKKGFSFEVCQYGSGRS